MKIKQFLPFFSYLFHPIFIPLYGSVFYFLTYQNMLPPNSIYMILIQISIITLMLPMALYFLLISLGLVRSFTEANIKERRIPLSIQAILFFILLKFSITIENLSELYLFFLGGFFSTVLALIAIMANYKASLHMIGITSLATFVYYLSVNYQLPYINMVATCFICVGLVASSRLYMKSHSPNELIVGSLFGIVPQVLLWHFWL
ncbi:hypothetical protein NHF50_07895 [Flavobacterium sp. NRK F10]|uniref:hypothetical protein n=1 Tax=Flavobacterium sp. NRK F10 TaxID=2954931 RepID=UPI0020901E24|nr:hypothetical protein [Flavobacterium sp. NRK F10]MCO6174967.1 hypothetical protein [Flavobacterium sp. NRK F10]